MDKYGVIVVGGGAAGMMAAVSAAERLDELGQKNSKVLLLEHNEKLGKKLFITGKGRCNLTNACDTEDLFNNIYRNPKFLYSAIYGFDNFRVMDFFESQGIALKTERGGRVFPESDHSSDIIRGLENKIRKNNIEVKLNCGARDIIFSADKSAVAGVLAKDGSKYYSDNVILATGGISYTSTGSTGDGHRIAEKSGHKVTELRASLIPLVCREEYAKKLQGLSLKNVRVSIFSGNKKVYDDSGEMMFTHYGVTGPLILSASGKCGDFLKKGELKLYIDLKMALDEQQLDKRILRDFEKNINKNFINAITELYPSKLIPVMADMSGIDPYKKVHEITQEERQELVRVTKAFPLTVTALYRMNDAIITRGGVDVKEINPSTMESKHIAGLYFAGEMIDVDAKTGGFNLQIAWSSGHLAGESAAERISADEQ